MSAPTERHETRALLRAHLAAASGYRHLTRHCPICHRLLRLAMEPLTAPQAPYSSREPRTTDDPPPAPETAADAPGRERGAASDPHPSPREQSGPEKDESPPAA
ncbi:DUF6274 family protein [Streptomyces sp. NBC_00059]|uniref:DUF6274 family protein n=1 Tax=Streptomyces sp. NBC_00059 TaxID=2975635 RepID=UPI002255214A|nr:DUF6274 family protein [Streptomyces sp. NBC_00059]MCX5411236.1 DUF6274 family protein [Streptomyces sp. NBC_00059]